MNIITIDIEEWYTYELYPKGGKSYYLPILNNYLDSIINLFESNQIKCTFFCLGTIARNDPFVIKKIINHGHEIGCHSDLHRLITSMSRQQFQDDTRVAIDSIEQVIGEKVTMYRAPAFSITESTKWALEVLIENGIDYDCSIFPTSHRFGGLESFDEKGPAIINTPSGRIREFPINFFSLFGRKVIFSGGGYFRFFPYDFIKYLTKRSNYNMGYFHIRDMDKYQLKVSGVNKFYSYYGIKNNYNKFDKYISEFQFISVGEASEKVNWNSVPVISI